MCTLALAWKVFADAPVVVGANRDEAVGRPSRPPEQYATDPAVVAPRDTEAGGTWIGVNEHGLFVGITNRWTDASLAGERSRGLLVADALECESVAEASALVDRETGAREYDGFYLVLADDEDAVVLGWDGQLSETVLEPGVHVVVNVGLVGGEAVLDVPDHRPDLGDQQAANARAVQDALEANPEEAVEGWLDRAGSVLADHEYGVCVHGDGFGTRSSSLLALGGPAGPTYQYADGPPCRTDYQRVAAIEAVESHI